MIGRRVSRLLLPGLLVFCLAGCQLNRGLALQQMQERFEETGQVVSHAQRCGAPVDEADVKARLIRHAEAQGASENEQQSLLSYYEAAKQLEIRNTGQKTCTEDDRIRETALLNEQLNKLQE